VYLSDPVPRSVHDKKAAQERGSSIWEHHSRYEVSERRLHNRSWRKTVAGASQYIVLSAQLGFRRYPVRN